jgi:N-acetylglucosamine malate deacetylase 1
MTRDTGETILVVAAHPDDEVLGCGATMALRAAQGFSVHLAVVATGAAGRFAEPAKHQAEIQAQRAALREEMDFAARILEFASVRCLDFPDNRLDTVSRMDIAHALDRVIEEIHPAVIYTHHPGDYNWDHTLVFDAVMMAARVSPGEFSPREIYAFEVLSATERAWREPSRAFHPNVWVDVARTIEKKKLALKQYRSEYRDYPHPRSAEGIEYLARMRGLEVGLEYAEAFELIRSVES